MWKHWCFLWLTSNTELLVAVWMTLSLLAILVTIETVDKNIVETKCPLVDIQRAGQEVLMNNIRKQSKFIRSYYCLWLFVSSRHTVVWQKYIKVNVQCK